MFGFFMNTICKNLKIYLAILAMSVSCGKTSKKSAPPPAEEGNVEQVAPITGGAKLANNGKATIKGQIQLGGSIEGFNLLGSESVKIIVKEVDSSGPEIRLNEIAVFESEPDGSFSVDALTYNDLIIEAKIGGELVESLKVVIPSSQKNSQASSIVLDEVSNIATQVYMNIAKSEEGKNLIKNDGLDFFALYQTSLLTKQVLEESIKDYGNTDILSMEPITEAMEDLAASFVEENIVRNEEVEKSGKNIQKVLQDQEKEFFSLSEDNSEDNFWEEKILSSKFAPIVTKKSIENKILLNGLADHTATRSAEEKAILDSEKKSEIKKNIMKTALDNDDISGKLSSCDESNPVCQRIKNMIKQIPKDDKTTEEKKKALLSMVDAEKANTNVEIAEKSELTPEEEKDQQFDNKTINDDELVEKAKEEENIALIKKIEEQEKPEENEPEQGEEGESDDDRELNSERESEENREEETQEAREEETREAREEGSEGEPEEDSEEETEQNEEQEAREQETLQAEEPEVRCVITLTGCANNTIEPGVKIIPALSAPRPELCTEQAINTHRACENSPEDSTKAEFYQDDVLLEQYVIDSACEIEQKVCKKNSARAGRFYDYHQNSDTNSERCLKRALEISKSCGNSYADATVARYYQGDRLIAEKSTLESACEIEQNVCRKHQDRVGKFLDNHRNSGKDLDACLNRANQYASWCGNSYEDVTIARFFKDGSLVKERSTHESACEIEILKCAEKPRREGKFLDNNRNAIGDKNKCIARAHAYHRWCKNTYKDEIIATYYEKGELVQVESTRASACEIHQNTCAKNHKKSGTFLDYHKNANKDKDRCLKRAIEYHRWCKNDVTQITTATFYQAGQVIAQADTKSGCLLEIEVCTKHPDRAGRFMDNGRGADSSQTKCLARANFFHKYCQNSYFNPVVAKFMKDDVVLAEKSSFASACIIEQDVCRKRPHKVGSFSDFHKNADTDQARCMGRALQYHRWCGNTFDEVSTAKFYKNGDLLETKDTSSACVIEQDTCRLHPKKIGKLIDWHRTSSTDQKVCLKRASQVHRWCGNSFSELTTASFYEKGELKASNDTSSGCLIEQKECRARKHRSGEFFDFHQNADTNKDRCLRRAKEYHRWCKNPYDSPTSAKFYVKGELLGEANTSTACIIKQDVCKKHPKWVGEFSDYAKGADQKDDVCLNRAVSYHRWCGNDFEDVTKASFYHKGEEFAFADTKSGCFIKIKTCKRRPAKVGGFFDNYQNSSFDSSRCIQRASDYQKWCRNSDDIGGAVEATFYLDGRVIESAVVP